MFRRKVKGISEVVSAVLRESGLETPLLQHRLISAWDTVAGPVAARYTSDKYIRNRVLYVRLGSAALRSDLSMMRSSLVRRLNNAVGAQVITDIRFS